jgi:predicted MPP superfamily phosphohydrolase
VLALQGRSRRIGLGLSALLVLSSIGLGLYALWIEPSRFVVRHETLALPHWPVAESGLRVALLSDLHVGSPYWTLSRLQRLIDATNHEHPDLVLLAGDYLINGVRFGRWVAPEPIARVLGELSAPLGVVAVLGNHDWWNDGPRVQRALTSAGIHVLDNQVLPIEHAGSRFYVVGIADLLTRPVDVPRTLALVPSGEPFLVLTHEPDVFPQVDGRAALTLAGHTHGGQVALPLIGRPLVPSVYGQRYAAGHIVEGDRQLFVTTGVGTSIFPVRLGVPPEVMILELRSRTPGLH